MHPIRILILAVLIYILYRLLFGKKKIKAAPRQDSTPELADTLEEDPICHTYIPRKEALTLEHNGTIHYFCSEECRQKFQQQQ